MTITQRIELRRLGYTKEEINELAEMEKAPQPEVVPEAPQPEAVQEPESPQPEVTQPQNDISSQLLYAINNLTAVLQKQKLNQSAQPEVKQETVDDIFTNILKG